MTEDLNCKWLYIEGDLPDWLASGYEAVGFTREGIGWAVQNLYQLPNEDGVTVSMFPLEDEECFVQTIGPELEWQARMAAQPENAALPPWHRASATSCRIITQAECDAIHARLLALHEQRLAEMANIPTEEDIYRAQQLLLLTELCNGVAALQDSQAGKEDRSNV